MGSLYLYKRLVLFSFFGGLVGALLGVAATTLPPPLGPGLLLVLIGAVLLAILLVGRTTGPRVRAAGQTRAPAPEPAPAIEAPLPPAEPTAVPAGPQRAPEPRPIRARVTTYQAGHPAVARQIGVRLGKRGQRG